MPWGDAPTRGAMLARLDAFRAVRGRVWRRRQGRQSSGRVRWGHEVKRPAPGIFARRHATPARLARE